MSGKDDFVVSRILGDKKIALLLIRGPTGRIFHHHCHPLSKIVLDGGGHTLECVDGAVSLMSFADCAKFELYAKPTRNQNRTLTVTVEGREEYFRRTGEPRETFQAVKVSSPYQPKFGGGSNR